MFNPRFETKLTKLYDWLRKSIVGKEQLNLRRAPASNSFFLKKAAKKLKAVGGKPSFSSCQLISQRPLFPNLSCVKMQVNLSSSFVWQSRTFLNCQGPLLKIFQQFLFAVASEKYAFVQLSRSQIWVLTFPFETIPWIKFREAEAKALCRLRSVRQSR